jgi:hypothetical protein
MVVGSKRFKKDVTTSPIVIRGDFLIPNRIRNITSDFDRFRLTTITAI